MYMDKNYYRYEDNEVIQFKRGTSSALRKRNPVLLEGQPCIELDTLRFKIGDGKTKYNNLPYINKISSGEGGADGLSAYEIWLELGNYGSEEDFINSLKGEDGKNGADGTDGKSAYDIWLDLGNTGSEKDFINSLKGADGADGEDGATGSDGKSAYEVWLELGNTGTEEDFINSLKGEDGADGADGEKGENGEDGKSAYKVWLDLGNTGTEEDFINSLKGTDGTDGKSAYEVWLELGNTGTEEDFINSLKGADGSGSATGSDGKSAYEVWLELGNTGTEEDFINSLKGEDGSDGKSAYEVWLELGNTGTEEDFINSLKGEDGTDGTDGEKGENGADGTDGKSAYEVWLDLGNTGTEEDFINSLKGADGATGSDGKSAYEVWLELGNTGTEEDFINSLKGEDGTDINSSDEKVKLNSASTDSKYLEDLIDGSTIKTDTTNNVIYVEKIFGQTVTVAEINLLAGATSNIQEQINNLAKSTSMYGVFNTKADLLAKTSPTPVDGNIAIVIADESNNGVQMTYIYIENGSKWTQVSECTVSVRDFTTDPINLETEVTGTLAEDKIDANIARLDKVLDQDTYKGTEDGVVKSADTLKDLSYSVDEINDAVNDSHTHDNKDLLDKIISTGLGNKFLSDNGDYEEIIILSSTEPSDTSKLWIDNSDTDNPVLKIYDSEWITIGGVSVPITIDDTISDSSTNPVQNRVVKEYIDQKTLVSSLALTEREW